ncbi:MAG: ABC transporter substrate-binding protein, partial [bacterium]
MMRRGRRWSIVALVLVMALAVSVYPLTAAPAPGTPYKLGFISSVTGPGASLGTPERDVARIIQERIAAEGGVTGPDGVRHDVQFLIFDDASRPDTAAGLVRRLIEQERVTVLVAGTLSGASLAMVPIASEARTPMISMASARAIIEDPQTKRMRPWV